MVAAMGYEIKVGTGGGLDVSYYWLHHPFPFPFPLFSKGLNPKCLNMLSDKHCWTCGILVLTFLNPQIHMRLPCLLRVPMRHTILLPGCSESRPGSPSRFGIVFVCVISCTWLALSSCSRFSFLIWFP